MRMILNLDKLIHSQSVLPTGQSGNFKSKHYDDQALMFANGELKMYLMERSEVKANAVKRLVLE